MYKFILFIVATIVITWISRSSLRNAHNHGFYRFFSWEILLILFLMNVDDWFVDPFSVWQIFSWTFLTLSLVLIILGVRTFRQSGGIDQERNDPTLVGIEKTTELVTSGVYHYIRHPFYSSLLFLGWGIFLKNINWVGIILVVANSVLLFVTAKKEESEDIRYFGNAYQAYIERTKMFIPYLF